MLAALIIVFREVLEAGLIVGVVLAASRGVPHRGSAIALGVLAGIVGSAWWRSSPLRFPRPSKAAARSSSPLAVLLLAVCMLAWHVVWMSEHAREMTARLRAHRTGGGARLAIGRHSLASSWASPSCARAARSCCSSPGFSCRAVTERLSLLIGSVGGLALGALVSAVVYLGLAAVPIGRLFSVTGTLITLLAAGLAAQAMQQLSSAGVINVFDGTLWDTSWLLSEEQLARPRPACRSIGYMDRPTAMQAIAYVATAATIFALSASKRQRQPVHE